MKVCRVPGNFWEVNKSSFQTNESIVAFSDQMQSCDQACTLIELSQDRSSAIIYNH